MNHQNKYVFVCLLAIATFLSVASLQPALAQSAPSLGAASSFSVLGGQAVTCTNSVITGDVGVSPTPAFTNAGCTIAGNTPPATDVAAALARAAFLSAYNALGLMPCGQTFSTAAFTGNVPALGPLAPGVYCFPAAVTFTDTTLTLDGSTNPNGIWIFKVGAALTGSGFQVVMANGAQACNVFWSVGAATTLSTSTLPPLFQGNILAGDAAGGSGTITGGSLIGRVMTNVAVTMTATNIHGSCALTSQALATCQAGDNDDDDKDKDKDKDKDEDKDQDKNQDKDNGKPRRIGSPSTKTETTGCLEAPPVPRLQLRPQAYRLLFAARSICLGERTTGFRPICKWRPRRSRGTQMFRPRRALLHQIRSSGRTSRRGKKWTPSFRGAERMLSR